MPDEKPPKPYPTFPLFPHARGYWAKKIAGRQESFGRWAWPDAAAYEASWRAALDDYNGKLEARAKGATLAAQPAGTVTVERLADGYLTHQHRRYKAGEITARMFADCKDVALHFRDAVGRATTVGDLERDAGPVNAWRAELQTRLGWHAFNRWNAIAAAMFGWGEDKRRGGFIGHPSDVRKLFRKKEKVHLRRQQRKHAAAKGKRRWEPDELRALLDHADGPLLAMLLLGYFAAYGNNDVAELARPSVTFKPDPKLGLPAGWATIHFPRPKTEIERAAAVPPAVADALRAAIALGRPVREPRWAPLVFRTVGGFPYVRDAVHTDAQGRIKKVVPVDGVMTLFRKLRDGLGRCPDHGWVRRHSGRRGGRPKAGQTSVLAVDWAHEAPVAGADGRPVTAWDRCPCEAGPAGEGRPPRRCGRALEPMRTMGFRALRRTAATFASGSADVDTVHRWRGHALEGMSDVYVEDIEAHKLVRLGQRLIEKLHEGGECRAVSPSGASPPAAGVAGASPPPAAGGPGRAA